MGVNNNYPDSFTGANWRSPKTLPPHTGPGSNGLQIGDECIGYDGYLWFFLYTGLLQVGGINYVSTPIQGDIW